MIEEERAEEAVMPYREVLAREQGFLLPPTLEDYLPDDHPARFVAEFAASLDLAGLGLLVEAAAAGRPRYRPEHLLCCWLYGFMTKTRSSRLLERACTENVALMWLTGGERPDHNTLWRYYRAHRKAMRALFRQTVRLAVDMGLVDFALQAVDGTRIAASGAGRRTLSRAELAALLERVEASIAALEAQHRAEAGSENPTWRLSSDLRNQTRLRDRVREGLARLDAEPTWSTVNLTDLDARRMQTAHDRLTGYNAQAVADGSQAILVAMDVTTDGSDAHQLLPMLEEAEAIGGRRAAEVVADAGYSSGANLEAMQSAGLSFYAPLQPPSNATQKPAYYASRFRYDRERDRYVCPEGQAIVYVYSSQRGGRERRVYRGQACAGCPARPDCTTNPRGRTIERMPWAEAVEEHRQRMATDVAKERMRRRRTLIEPAFGTLKERLGLRQFLLRSLDGVRAEWLLAGSAYNLLKLYRHWWRPLHPRPAPA